MNYFSTFYPSLVHNKNTKKHQLFITNAFYQIDIEYSYFSILALLLIALDSSLLKQLRPLYPLNNW